MTRSFDDFRLRSDFWIDAKANNGISSSF